MPELKPCPFCGSEALISWNNKFGWQAFCENDSCFMSQIISTTFETEEQAIHSWNNRWGPLDQQGSAWNQIAGGDWE